MPQHDTLTRRQLRFHKSDNADFLDHPPDSDSGDPGGGVFSLVLPKDSSSVDTVDVDLASTGRYTT